MRIRVLLVGAFLAPVAPACADEPNLFYGYLQLMNNYIGRGLSQSIGKPSWQAEIDANPGSGFYGNLSAVHIGWIDKIHPTDSVHTEIDGVLGYRVLFGQGAEFKAGVLQLQFPGRYRLQSPPVSRPDTTEVFAFINCFWGNSPLSRILKVESCLPFETLRRPAYKCSTSRAKDQSPTAWNYRRTPRWYAKGSE